MTDGFEYAIKDWAEIKDNYENGNLIIGNGASVALHQKFRFDSLKEEAEKLRLFNDDISKLFIEFDTSDFELILRLVWHAKLINKHLGIVDQKLDSAYENIKQALIKVVKEVHCEHSDIADQLPQLYQFTKQFRTVVSLNYDLILYWILMYGNRNEDGHRFKDCFQGSGLFRNNWQDLRNPIRKEKEVTLSLYQHGNLSIFRDAKNTETKVQRGDFEGLLEVITSQWEDNKIPLFVAEGTGTKKLESIKSSSYLSTIFYEVLPDLITQKANLVIYGWSLGKQESHLVKQIFKNKQSGKVAISIFQNNQEECHRIYRLIKNEKVAPNIEIEFFDSQSSGCWNNP
ncbi:hypothetical protein J2X86_000724 [Acinetobacter lwoffii]|jgi:hypothetical protein|uniref:DUF4917 family protein n=2 Tax=Acinetobacter lwoffii TaxID=28090 RepID=A0AAW8LKW5_ACILW|nr:DUF4917 family protein [Acinetobacter lwoffii]MCJ0929085.1 DUF4917 family protein [Acinetobacter lwoffii]MCO8093551.1 DUF4917 family protein [Acinetobacter lwoffii]MDR6628713.1 hypothetical protein [Acinetobacter lwoffii]QZM11257.1 hypothetical protein ABVS_0520 [Acinetobacter lwoffii]